MRASRNSHTSRIPADDRGSRACAVVISFLPPSLHLHVTTCTLHCCCSFLFLCAFFVDFTSFDKNIRSMSERGRLRSQRSSIAAPEKFTDDYFDQNPDKFCSIVSFVLKKQQDEPATWTRIDKIFGFPKNKGELTKEELSDYLPPQDRVREIMKKLEFTQFSELEVGVFGKWLAGNGGFFGLVEGDAIWKKSEGLAYVAFLRQ